MKSMTLHQLQQVSNIKEEEDWSEYRTLRHSNNIANDIGILQSGPAYVQ